MKTDISRSGSLSNEVRFMSRMTLFLRSGLAITLQLLCVSGPKPGQKGSKSVIFWSLSGHRFLRVCQGACQTRWCLARICQKSAKSSWKSTLFDHFLVPFHAKTGVKQLNPVPARPSHPGQKRQLCPGSYPTITPDRLWLGPATGP